MNGKLPIGPIPISPDMLSPETVPVKASVSGIGLVMEIFQATSSPLVVPAKIPPELEQQVGDELMVEVKKTETIVQDPKLIAKLDRAVGPLMNRLPASQVQYKFYLVQELMPNAFALPGGHVLVTTRWSDWYGHAEEVPVDVFGRDEAIEFILKATGRTDRDGSACPHEERCLRALDR